MRNSLVLAVAALMVSSSALAQTGSAPARCPHDGADDRSVLVSVVVRDELRHLGATVDTVLGELGYRVSVAESGIGQWVTEPRRDWPLGTEREAWHGTEQPGVQVVVDFAPDTAGTRISIAASAICRVSATVGAERRSGSVESTLETLSAMQVATAIGRHLERPRTPPAKPTP